MQAEDRGFADVLRATFPSGTAPGVAAASDQARRNSERLVVRARRDGKLRRDFAPQDFIWILIANRAYLEATPKVAPEAWRRYAALILDGARSPNRSKLPSPPNPEQIEQVLAG
jgi:hypothetical protein